MSESQLLALLTPHEEACDMLFAIGTIAGAISPDHISGDSSDQKQMSPSVNNKESELLAEPITITDDTDGLDAAFEKAIRGDPAIELEQRSALRNALGLDSPDLVALLERSEFVSLGGFCGVSSALAALGLRTSAGPFDWVRCSMESILQCLETAFRDFLTFKTTQVLGGHKVFQGSEWGGSFWHHDIEDQTIKNQFLRRIERHFGTQQREHAAPRFFVRVANCTEELHLASTLLATLQLAFYNSPVYLLVIVDMQTDDSLIHVSGSSSHLIFHYVHHDLWLNHFTDARAQMNTVAEKYAACISAAVRLWAAEIIAPSREPAVHLNFQGQVVSYNAGDPAYKGYSPQGEQAGNIRVQEGFKAGDTMHIRNFGDKSHEIMSFTVPEGVVAGCLLGIRVTTAGVLHVRLVPDASAASAVAILAAAAATTAAEAAAATAVASGSTDAAAMFRSEPWIESPDIVCENNMVTVGK